MNNLNITSKVQDDVTLIKLAGSADMMSVSYLDKELASIVSAGNKFLVIDLSELAFICSMAIGSLIQVYSVCREKEVDLSLAGAQPAISKMFHTSQLNKLFDIYAGVDDAVRDHS